MELWSKPKLIVSKCLNGHNCRYNGEASSSKFIDRLQPFINIIEVCPEEDMGLATPRNAIRLVEQQGKINLIDPKTLKDYTSLMVEFAEESYIDLKDKTPQGAILKGKSPSCGLRDTSIYSSPEKGAMTLRKGSGLYGGFLKKQFPLLPIEDDGRLNNFSIREQFLIKIFTLSLFEDIKIANNISELVKFHSQNKLLFIGYSQSITKRMGRLIASHGTITFKNILKLYEMELLKLLSRNIRYTSMINVFIHAYSYFTKYLRSGEKEFFLEIIDKYRSGTCPQCVVINILKGYAIRFNNTYLLNQTLLSPYPEELMDFSDSGKGITRD